MLFQNRNRVLKILPLLVLLHIMLLASSSAKSFNISQSQASDNQSSLTVLERGKTIEREIKGTESHTYLVNLSAGQFLNGVVEQNGIELGVALYDSANKELIDITAWNRNVGRAPIQWIAEETGSYRIRLYPLNKEAVTGRYQIRV